MSRVALLIVTSLVAVACSQRAPEGSVCDPGATQACVCGDSRMGAQSCNSSGDGWNACGCTSGPITPQCAEGTGTGALGCTKVDFLFVVDNSLSMQRAQAKLREAFPEFISTVRASVRAQDYHIMVVDTDGLAPSTYQWGLCQTQCDMGGADLFPGQAYTFAFDDSCDHTALTVKPPECLACAMSRSCCVGGSENALCARGGPGGDALPACDSSVPTDICEGTPYGTTTPSWWCENYECGELATMDACDSALGAGVRHPIAPNASNSVCNFAGGRRYISSEDTDVESLFACAAQVGSFGYGHEQPVGAVLEAVSSALNADDGCNAGFLRPDALLVVTFLTDANADQGSVEEQAGVVGVWREQLVNAKCGNENAIVMLGLLGDGDIPGGGCQYGSVYQSAHVRSLVESFDENGFAGSICDDDFGDFFADAVATIDSACEALLY